MVSSGVKLKRVLFCGCLFQDSEVLYRHAVQDHTVTADSAEEAEDLVYDYGTYDSVNEEIVHLGDTIDETIREI